MRTLKKFLVSLEEKILLSPSTTENTPKDAAQSVETAVIEITAAPLLLKDSVRIDLTSSFKPPGNTATIPERITSVEKGKNLSKLNSNKISGMNEIVIKNALCAE